eukprot:g23619.t1
MYRTRIGYPCSLPPARPWRLAHPRANFRSACTAGRDPAGRTPGPTKPEGLRCGTQEQLRYHPCQYVVTTWTFVGLLENPAARKLAMSDYWATEGEVICTFLPPPNDGRDHGSTKKAKLTSSELDEVSQAASGSRAWACLAQYLRCGLAPDFLRQYTFGVDLVPCLPDREIGAPEVVYLADGLLPSAGEERLMQAPAWRTGCCRGHMVRAKLFWLLLLLCVACWPRAAHAADLTQPVQEEAKGEAAQAEEAKSEGEGEDEAHLHVKCETTKGNLTITMHREWGPRGHDHFLRLVRASFFTDSLFYSVWPGFMIQTGFHRHPRVQHIWGRRRLKDDNRTDIPFTKGTLGFSGGGARPDSRATPFFIALEEGVETLGKDPKRRHEVPFARIEDEAEHAVLDALHSVGEKGQEVHQRLIDEGTWSVLEDFPELDRILRCWVVEELGEAPPQDYPNHSELEVGVEGDRSAWDKYKLEGGDESGSGEDEGQAEVQNDEAKQGEATAGSNEGERPKDELRML